MPMTNDLPRAWMQIKGRKTLNTLRDEDCPSCEFPETINVRSLAGKTLRVGCTHCGYWRTAKEWNKKNPSAVDLGSKGGKATAKKLTPDQRSASARRAARARWAKAKGEGK